MERFRAELPYLVREVFIGLEGPDLLMLNTIGVIAFLLLVTALTIIGKKIKNGRIPTNDRSFLQTITLPWIFVFWTIYVTNILSARNIFDDWTNVRVILTFVFFTLLSVVSISKFGRTRISNKEDAQIQRDGNSFGVLTLCSIAAVIYQLFGSNDRMTALPESYLLGITILYLATQLRRIHFLGK